MNNQPTFGSKIKALRLRAKKSLRAFCLEHGFDPGNHSRLERGISKPPVDEEWLTKLGLSLGLNEESDDMRELFDLAYIANKQIPEYIMSDQELLSRLPAFFRTIGNSQHSKEKLESLIEKIKTT